MRPDPEESTSMGLSTHMSTIESSTPFAGEDVMLTIKESQRRQCLSPKKDIIIDSAELDSGRGPQVSEFLAERISFETAQPAMPAHESPLKEEKKSLPK